MIVKVIKNICVLGVFFLYSTVYAAELANTEKYFITQQQWSIPKKAESILLIPALNSVMNILSDKRDKNLILSYPGGDVGVLWASELKAWLVALGLASSRIVLQSGSANATQIQLIII